MPYRYKAILIGIVCMGNYFNLEFIFQDHKYKFSEMALTPAQIHTSKQASKQASSACNWALYYCIEIDDS